MVLCCNKRFRYQTSNVRYHLSTFMDIAYCYANVGVFILFLSFYFPSHKHFHKSGLCWLHKWFRVDKQISTMHPLYNMKLILHAFLMQVQSTVMIMTAVVVRVEKERVTSFIHNATSCGCIAFWSIFSHCQGGDSYLVFLYTDFSPCECWCKMVSV